MSGLALAHGSLTARAAEEIERAQILWLADLARAS